MAQYIVTKVSLEHAAIAHRGGADLAPENTLAAFSLSYALGLRQLETDVQTTRDGVAVAFHDTHLARCTGVDARVRDLSWDEVRSVRVSGEPLLRLDDLLAAFPDASFLVDIKSQRNVASSVEAINRVGAGARVCVADGRERWLTNVTSATGARRSLGWGELLALLAAAKLGTKAPASGRGAVDAHVATRLGGVAWMADPRAAARLVAMTHDAGLRLVTWTVNDPTHMTRYLDTGADAIITDRPDLLRDVLIARGEWVAPAALPTAPPRPAEAAFVQTCGVRTPHL